MALSDRDTYLTPDGPSIGLLARHVPALPFYLRVLCVVIRASWKARRGVYDADQWVASSESVVRALESVGMRLNVEGLGVLRSFDGPAVFVANHLSTLETFVLPCLIQPSKPVTFVVKESLVRYPLFGPVMRSRDPITVGRANPREDLAAVLEGGAERLARGISVIVFPQGTRHPEVQAGQFNSLGAKLAVRARVPLVPVAIDSRAWGTGRRVKDVGPLFPGIPVRLRFGEALPPAGRGNENHDAAVRFIVETVAAWRNEPAEPRRTADSPSSWSDSTAS